MISTHTPLAGRDWAVTQLPHWIGFLLTRPLRDVTCTGTQGGPDFSISTHTPLAGRDFTFPGLPPGDCISTHTPLAGRDDNTKTKSEELKDFYSHAPCGT